MADFLTHVGADGNEHLKPSNPIRFVVRPHLVNWRGTLHAGIAPTICAEAMGVAAAETLAPGEILLTVDLHTTFVSGTKIGDEIVATGKVIKRGKDLALCTAEMIRVSDEKLIATARTTFAIRGPRPDKK